MINSPHPSRVEVDLDLAAELSRRSVALGRRTRVHVKVDTGLGRLSAPAGLSSSAPGEHDEGPAPGRGAGPSGGRSSRPGWPAAYQE